MTWMSTSTLWTYCTSSRVIMYNVQQLIHNFFSLHFIAKSIAVHLSYNPKVTWVQIFSLFQTTSSSKKCSCSKQMTFSHLLLDIISYTFIIWIRNIVSFLTQHDAKVDTIDITIRHPYSAWYYRFEFEEIVIYTRPWQ